MVKVYIAVVTRQFYARVKEIVCMQKHAEHAIASEMVHAALLAMALRR